MWKIFNFSKLVAMVRGWLRWWDNPFLSVGMLVIMCVLSLQMKTPDTSVTLTLAQTDSRSEDDRYPPSSTLTPPVILLSSSSSGIFIQSKPMGHKICTQRLVAKFANANTVCVCLQFNHSTVYSITIQIISATLINLPPELYITTRFRLQ